MPPRISPDVHEHSSIELLLGRQLDDVDGKFQLLLLQERQHVIEKDVEVFGAVAERDDYGDAMARQTQTRFEEPPREHVANVLGFDSLHILKRNEHEHRYVFPALRERNDSSVCPSALLPSHSFVPQFSRLSDAEGEWEGNLNNVEARARVGRVACWGVQ